jgi:hypothetical protein
VSKISSEISSLIERNRPEKAIAKIKEITDSSIIESLFVLALNNNKMNIANALLEQGFKLEEIKPKLLNIDYSDSEAFNFKMYVSNFIQKPVSCTLYQDALNRQRDEYCSAIQAEVRNLRIIGIKMFMSLVSDKNKKDQLSTALSNYQQGGTVDDIQKIINEIKLNRTSMIVNLADNTEKDNVYKKAISVLNKVDHLEDNIKEFNKPERNLVDKLADFIRSANLNLETPDNCVEIDNPLNQKIKACFDAIRKAIYNVTGFGFIISNEQKEKITLKSMKEEIAKLKPDEETQQSTLVYE